MILLIGLPAVFNTPGDRPGGGALVAVPGTVPILLLLLQLVAATASAWAIWPWWAAVPVTALCLIVPISEQPRWRRLLAQPKTQHGVNRPTERPYYADHAPSHPGEQHPDGL